MSNNILFIFEGEKTEDIIVQSLQKHILSKDNLIIKCAFCAEIYQLYKEIEKDEYFDIFNLIKERGSKNEELLGSYNRYDFAEIYLFFDYDAHASLASSTDKSGNPVKEGDEKLKDLLSFFDNETERGKLYISYPMVEALRHIVKYETFNELTVKCKGDNCKYQNECEKKEECIKESNYKEKVGNESISQLCNTNSYTTEIWKKLISAHLSKMNYIVNNKYEYPSKIESQQDIFAHQLEKHINNKCPMVSVLSAFPVFIHDYYGNEKTKEKLGSFAFLSI